MHKRNVSNKKQVKRGPIKVFFADDNEDLCFFVTSKIQKQSDMILVGVAREGCAVLKGIWELRPDVVVLDLVMPEMDGIEVLETLKKGKNGYSPRIIVLTALSDEEVAHQVLNLGADYCLLKPFSIDILMDRIRQVKVAFAPPKETKYELDEVGPVVADYLLEMGMPPHLSGFLYMQEAVSMVLQNKGLLRGVTTQLYPAIALLYRVKPAMVERAVRGAIDYVWTRGNTDYLYKFFGPAVDETKGKPSNSAFIAMLSDKVLLDLKSS